MPLLAIGVGLPLALLLAGGAWAPSAIWTRRRRSVLAPAFAVGAAGATRAYRRPRSPPRLHVDGDTRRVYVKGIEAKPPLSNEQFRLLAYLYERAGKVVSRDELVAHVWPDAHVEGVSEEALDALVRRVRERLVQAGGERVVHRHAARPGLPPRGR